MTYFRTPFVEALLVAVDGAGKGREVRGGEVMSVMIIPVIAKIRTPTKTLSVWKVAPALRLRGDIANGP